MSTPAVLPQFVGDLGTPELLIILAVVVLLFGSSKLPELARGSGRALRIFKAETKGLTDADDAGEDTGATTAGAPSTPAGTDTPYVPPARPTSAELEARRRELAARQDELDAEREKLRGQSA